MKMLDPMKERGIKELDTANPRGLQTVETLKRKTLTMADIRTKRYTTDARQPALFRAKADNGRTLSLGSAAWKRLRAYVLSDEPCCRMCTAQGLTVIATDVDHRDNDPSNNELVNLQPLCRSHHSLKTQADMGHRVSLGCDMSGQPADPMHHWNKASLSRPDASALPSCAASAEKSPATDGHEPTGIPYVFAVSKDQS